MDVEHAPFPARRYEQLVQETCMHDEPEGVGGQRFPDGGAEGLRVGEIVPLNDMLWDTGIGGNRQTTDAGLAANHTAHRDRQIATLDRREKVGECPALPGEQNRNGKVTGKCHVGPSLIHAQRIPAPCASGKPAATGKFSDYLRIQRNSEWEGR